MHDLPVLGHGRTIGIEVLGWIHDAYLLDSSLWSCRADFSLSVRHSLSLLAARSRKPTLRKTKEKYTSDNTVLLMQSLSSRRAVGSLVCVVACVCLVVCSRSMDVGGRSCWRVSAGVTDKVREGTGG